MWREVEIDTAAGLHCRSRFSISRAFISVAR
jgi:hypothetical protein